jgi:quercetin dioxygenase-like cupin family protein
MNPGSTWLAAGVFSLLCASALQAQTPAKPETTVLLQSASSWNNVPYKAYPTGLPQLTILRIVIPAHSAMPWHTHAIPNAAYVLSGALTVEDRATGAKATYRAGEALAECVGVVHRGVTGDEPAVLIVTYSGTPGQALSTPVAEAGE